MFEFVFIDPLGHGESSEDHQNKLCGFAYTSVIIYLFRHYIILVAYILTKILNYEAMTLMQM